MSNLIRILDVSTYIHAGMETSFGKRASYKGIPTGGIFNLLQAIGKCIKDSEPFALVFDSPTNAREILPEYKGTRPKNPAIRFQSDLAYKYLYGKLPNTFKIPNFEADHLAYNICENVREYGTKFATILHSIDYDWAHNILDEYQLLRPSAATGAAFVDSDNFTDLFSEKGLILPINALSAKKVFLGDDSDNISVFESGTSYTNEKLVTAFIQYCRNNHLDFRELDSMLEFLQKMKGLFGEQYDYLVSRAKVIYPWKVPDRKNVLELNLVPQSADCLSKLLSITGCEKLADRLGVKFYTDMGEAQTEVYNSYVTKYTVFKTEYFEATKRSNVQPPSRGGFII